MHDEYFLMDQNGKRTSDFCMYLEEYPSISHGQEEYKEYSVAGRGSIWTKTGAYKDTIIKLTADVNVAGTAEKWSDMYDEARKFFVECKRLFFCDAIGTFYKVKKVTIGGIKKYSEIAGDFDVEIVCEAGKFAEDGLFEYEFDDIRILNNVHSESHPTYIITGNGSCTLTVNGKTMKATVGQNLTIDTDRMIAYRVDGTMMNTSVTGDYEDIYLQPGENTVTITDGFELKIIPNWRCL